MPIAVYESITDLTSYEGGVSYAEENFDTVGFYLDVEKFEQAHMANPASVTEDFLSGLITRAAELEMGYTECGLTWLD